MIRIHSDTIRHACQRPGSTPLLRFAQARADPEKYLERYGKISICRIQCGGLRVDSHIRTCPQLPCVILHQIARSSESVAADAISRMLRRLGKQFVFIHPFQPRKGIIAPPENSALIQADSRSDWFAGPISCTRPQSANLPNCPTPVVGCTRWKPSAATGSMAPAPPDVSR